MSFKEFDAVSEPDFRNTFQGSLLPGREFQRMELREHYDMVSATALPANINEDIREMFDRARQAVLYAWFAYELSAPAQLYALATLEAALGFHFRRQDGLAALLKRAVAAGVFPDAYGARSNGQGPWLAKLRNILAHGANSFGTPLLATKAIREYADLIVLLAEVPGSPLVDLPPTPAAEA